MIITTLTIDAQLCLESVVVGRESSSQQLKASNYYEAKSDDLRTLRQFKILANNYRSENTLSSSPSNFCHHFA